MPTYIKGGAKEIEGKFGKFMNISLNLEDLQQHVNERGYVNITISPRREIGQYGDTHTMTLNEWTPNAGQQPQQAQSGSSDQGNDDISVEDIPF